MLSDAGRCLTIATTLAQLPGAQLDESVTSLVSECITGSNLHMVSKVVNAKAYDQRSRSFGERLRRLASACFWFDRYQRHTLEQDIANAFAKPSLIMYIDSQCYDEAPTKTTIVGDSANPNTDEQAVVAANLLA